MSLRLRLVLGAAVLLSVAFGWIAWSLDRDLRPRYKEVVEDALVELSRLAAAELSEGDPATLGSRAAALFGRMKAQRFEARIYSVLKNRVTLEAYVTDMRGTVVFDSEDPAMVGRDYSLWNDVRLTLDGQYGARSTRLDPQDKLSSVLHVAAPLRQHDAIVGVVSVRKSERALEAFLVQARRKLWVAGGGVLLAVTLAMVLFSMLVTRPIDRLIRYAVANREGQDRRLEVSQFASPEFRRLGNAFEDMRLALAGKKSVEVYVQNLTHELKSPLAAIRGSAELLSEDGMPEPDRQKFLAHIRTESERIREMIDRLLTVASLESRRGLENVEAIDAEVLARKVADTLAPLASQRRVTVTLNSAAAPVRRGERFLVEQALRNLLENALEFSPPDSRVTLNVRDDGQGRASFVILDEGLGIPAFAEARLFERFYSLERPATGKKGSGLGLSFVKEVAALHSGHSEVVNRTDRSGARATFTF